MSDVRLREIDEPVERTLLRDVARIRGTRPAPLAAVEDFILGWLRVSPEHGCIAYGDPAPAGFYADFAKWQSGLPQRWRWGNHPAHELDDDLDTLFWDLDIWLGLVCDSPLPAPTLDEAVLIDILATRREIEGRCVSAIWLRRYPEADLEQWRAWYHATSKFFGTPAWTAQEWAEWEALVAPLLQPLAKD